MSTEEIKTVILLAKVKSFTLAAEQLLVAQSTITNRIVEIEKEVGKKLFNRSPKGVTLTDEGKIFLKYAERLLELQEAGIAEVNSMKKQTQKFSIGAINAAYEAYVKPILDKALKTNADISANVILLHSLDLLQQIQDDMLDVVFATAPLRRHNYECKVFDTDRLVLVTGKNANKYKDGITREEIQSIPYLMCNFSTSEAGVFIQALFPDDHLFKLEVDTSSKLIPYLEKGYGYSFLPYKMIKKELESGKLEEVKLLDFSAPPFVTYFIHKKSFDPTGFLKYAKNV